MGISRWAADMFCLASSYSRSCRYSILVKERSIVMSMPVCLSVCLCLCLSISPELHVESSPRFSACYLWPWLGSAPDIRPRAVAAHVTCGRGLVLLRTFAPGQSPPMLPVAVAWSCSGHSPPGSRPPPDTRP